MNIYQREQQILTESFEKLDDAHIALHEYANIIRKLGQIRRRTQSGKYDTLSEADFANRVVQKIKEFKEYVVSRSKQTEIDERSFAQELDDVKKTEYVEEFKSDTVKVRLERYDDRNKFVIREVKTKYSTTLKKELYLMSRQEAYRIAKELGVEDYRLIRSPHVVIYVSDDENKYHYTDFIGTVCI